jgi:hypothetical protein
MKITFHGLCGISLLASPARVFFPFHYQAPHKAVLMAEARHLFKKEDAVTKHNVPDATWNPDGIGLTQNGRQFCFWILTAQERATTGARLLLKPEDTAPSQYPQRSTWARRGNVLDFVKPSAGKEILSTDARLGQGALLTLPAGRAAIAGKVEGADLKLVEPDYKTVQSGGFPNSINWTANDRKANWRLENGTGKDLLYIRFNSNARLTITNASPKFGEASANHHLAGFYEVLQQLGMSIPDGRQLRLEGPMLLSAEEGVNCIPPTDMP